MTTSAQKLKYYLIIDSGMQWFTYAIGRNDNGEIVCCTQIDNKISARIISDILKRHPYKNSWQITLPFINEAFYTAWSISSSEYHKLYKIAHLYEQYKEYLSLIE